MDKALLRNIPKVDELLAPTHALCPDASAAAVTAAVRRTLDALRESILSGEAPEIPETAALCALAADAARRAEMPSLRPVINATGVVLHTNLGRARLSGRAAKAAADAAEHYSTLEYDVESGGRGSRNAHVEELLCRLTGAESALVVNNNAAAVLLLLTALTAGGEVVVSRGELVEIGGSFRVPEIMSACGATLREVGTTNKTRAADYAAAIGEHTRALMKVHTSNYSIEGFTKAVDEAELAAIGRELDVPVVADLGSGSLVDLSQYGLPKEPMPQEMIAAGVSLVSFSGDKLLGGPQAGIIVGKRALIAQLQSHPLKRALRADKMTLAALEATLRLYQHPEALREKLPTLRLLTRPAEEIRRRAERLQPGLAAHYADFAVSVAACQSQIGSGSSNLLTASCVPSAALTFTPHDGRGSRLEALAARWRALPCPVIGRIYDGRLWLDLRCLEDETRFMEMLLR